MNFDITNHMIQVTHVLTSHSIGHLVDWWSDKEDEEFRQRAQCFIHQYGNFTVTQLAKMLEKLLGFR